jgi:hypothetical protein
VLAHRDAPTYRVEGRVVAHDQTPTPVGGGGESGTSYSISVDTVDGGHFRVAAVEPGLDLPLGQDVVLSVSSVDGSIAFVRAGPTLLDLRPGALEPVLLIVAALAGLSGVLFGAIHWNVYPPVSTWLALVLGASVAPVVVFAR